MYKSLNFLKNILMVWWVMLRNIFIELFPKHNRKTAYYETLAKLKNCDFY